MNLLKEKIFQSRYLTVALLLFQVYFGIIPGWKKITADFPNYYVSAKLLSEKKDLSCLYNNTIFNQQVKQFGINVQAQFALNPPANALIFLPLVNFEPLIAKRIWLVLNIFFILLGVVLIQKITKWKFIFSLNILLCSGFALANDLFLGQIYLFTTILLLTGYLLFSQNKDLFSGLFWGTVISIKYVPLIILPAIILKKKWKVLFGIILSVIAINLVCVLFFGIDVYIRFLNITFLSHVKGVLYEGKPYAIQYQSWESLLNNLFVYDPIDNRQPIFNYPQGFIIIKCMVWLFVMGSLIYFYKHFLRSKYFLEIIFSFSLISLLILEPGSATYHLLFLILPLILMLRILVEEGRSDAFCNLICLFLIIGFLPTLLNKFSLFNGGNIILSYHRLWLEMIFYFYSLHLFKRIEVKS